MFTLLLPAVQFDSSRDPRLALLLLPAVGLLTAFWVWERGPAARRGYPLIDLGLFKIRSYADGIGLAVLFFCATPARRWCWRCSCRAASVTRRSSPG